MFYIVLMAVIMFLFGMAVSGQRDKHLTLSGDNKEISRRTKNMMKMLCVRHKGRE